MRMHTVTGASIMRPTRSMARPGVTSISSCDGPTQVQAGKGGVPSGVVLPMAVLHIGKTAPATKTELAFVSNWLFCAGPAQVQAAMGGLPSSVVLPIAVIQPSGSAPDVKGVDALRIWTLPFESMMAVGTVNCTLGRHPL